MLAEEGGMLTPKDAHTRISNLEKALEALSMAIVRLSPSDDTVRICMYLVLVWFEGLNCHTHEHAKINCCTYYFFV